MPSAKASPDLFPARGSWRRLPFSLGYLLVLLLLTFALGACVSMQDPEGFQEQRQAVVLTLQPGQVAGQDFISRRPGLDSFQVWLRLKAPPPNSTGQIEFTLYHPDQPQPLASVSYSLESLKSSDQLTVRFPPRYKDAPNQAYRINIRISQGELDLIGRQEDIYPHGQAWLDDQPLEADLSFRLGYRYAYRAFLDDLQTWLNSAWLFLPLVALLWLPGRLLLRLARFDDRLDWGERSAAAVGISLAVIPLLMLWTSALGLPWSANGLRLVSLALFALWIGLWLYDTKPWVRNHPLLPHFSAHSLALFAAFVLSLAVRLVMVRDLAAPAWVDSVHHALITRLILDNGAFPASYAPFVQATTAHYHPGFHSLLASFIWLSGLDLPQGMLLFGQVLNALAVLAVYLLTTTFTRRPTAGVIGALIAGVVTPMPAYYTSWGRYTQLAGLLILPVAFLWLKYLLEWPVKLLPRPMIQRSQLWALLFASLTIAGLLLVHYRILAFLVALLAACLIIDLVVRGIHRSMEPRQVMDVLLGLLVAGLAGLFLTILWWPAALQNLVLPTSAFAGSPTPFSDFSWSYLTTAYGRYALGLAALGFLWGVIRRHAFPFILLLWFILLFFLANLGVFKLPGASLINNTAVAITLFMPIAVLGGYLLGWVLDGWGQFLPPKFQPIYWGVVILAIAPLSLLSGRALLPIINPGTLLVRQADLPAIEWVDENLPPDARLVINPFLWGYGIYAGSDGGYWISPLAKRLTLPPPALYNLDFDNNTPKQIARAARQVQTSGEDPVALYEVLTQQGIDYVFIGARGGPLSPARLDESPLFTKLYENQGVFVFQVNPSP